MLSLREIAAKTKDQRRAIRRELDKSNSNHGWCPDDANLYTGLSAADAMNVQQSFRQFSLAEVLVYGSSAQGADDLVAAKVHDTLIYAAEQYDVCSLIGYMVNQWEGGNLTVDITVHGSYKPKKFASVGTMPDVNAQITYATVSPVGYGVPVLVSNRMIEDNEFGIIQWHVEQAGASCGTLATELALNVLKTATDGDGDVYSSATGDSDETKWTGGATADIEDCYAAISDDHWTPNTLIMTTEAWEHSLNSTIKITASGTAVGSAADTYWTPDHVLNPVPVAVQLPAPGFHAKLGMPPLDVLYCNSDALHDAPEDAMTECVTIMCDRNNALLTGRKRWLEIKQYADPINDLSGAVVSFRQDSITLYDDAIAVLTET